MIIEQLLCPVRWARALRSLACQMILGRVLLESIQFAGKCEPHYPYSITFTFRFMNKKAINTFRNSLK